MIIQQQLNIINRRKNMRSTVPATPTNESEKNYIQNPPKYLHTITQWKGKHETMLTTDGTSDKTSQPKKGKQTLQTAQSLQSVKKGFQRGLLTNMNT